MFCLTKTYLLAVSKTNDRPVPNFIDYLFNRFREPNNTTPNTKLFRNHKQSMTWNLSLFVVTSFFDFRTPSVVLHVNERPAITMLVFLKCLNTHIFCLADRTHENLHLEI